jgi:carbonyl reductase 1
MRVAVVTGANRGIGEEIAAQLAARGLRVVRASRDAKAGPESFPLDVTSDDAVKALARHLAEGVDVVVNNAGVSLDGFDAEVAQKTLDVNFFGAMRVTDALLPLVREGGRIVMLSSGLGALSGLDAPMRACFEDPALDRATLVRLAQSFVEDVRRGDYRAKGWPGSAYRVSKISLNAITRIYARELEGDPRKILVNAVDPGWVKTRMGGRGAPRSVPDGARTPVWLALAPGGSPTGKVFRDEHVIPF